MPVFHRILVPVDGSKASAHAAALALQLARDDGARVRFLHAIDELAVIAGLEYAPDVLNEARKYAAKVLEDAGKQAQAAGVEFDTRLVDVPGQRLGNTVAEAAKQWEADLVVVGSVGRRGVSRLLLGSGAEQVVRLSQVPVLVARER